MNAQTSLSRTDQALEDFDRLPDAALVRLPTVARLFAASEVTIWRWSKNGKLPPPYRQEPRYTAWRVGDLRRALSEAA